MGDQMVGRALVRRALRWLAHPVSLGAVLVMALNDHVLKAEFGSWWTGKLSDVAGLVFFPAVVAVALAFVMPGSTRPPSAAAFRRLVMVATAVTGVGFVWVKATESGAGIASALLTAISGPSVVLKDATDLLALPALGLAVWVGLGVTERRRHHRALTVAALPVALLASVATGVSEDSHARIVVGEDGVWRGQVQAAYPYGGDAYYTHTGAGWSLFYEDDSADPSPVGPLPKRDQMQDCVPSDPSVCFRVLEGATGVETSDDGGATWGVDWQLTPNEVQTLERVYDQPQSEFETAGVGVVEAPDGYVVVAGNGTDGFAVRGPDGAWERVGFTGMACCDWLETADFDAVDELPEVHALPVGPVTGLVLSTLALPFLAGALRRGRPSQFHIGATIAGVFAYLLSAVGGVVVLSANSGYAPMTRAEPGLDALMYVMLGGVSVVGIVSGTAFFGLLRRGAVWATLLGWAVGAIVAGVAASAAPDGMRTQVAAALMGLVVAFAVYVPVARRFLVRYVQPPRRPRDP